MSVLPSQSLHEFLRLEGLKGKGEPSPEMSKFWIRWLRRFMSRQDASPPSRRNSCRDMRAGCWSHTLKQTVIQVDFLLRRQSSAEQLNRLQNSAPKYRYWKDPFLSSLVESLRIKMKCSYMHPVMKTLHWIHTTRAKCLLQCHVGDSRK